MVPLAAFLGWSSQDWIDTFGLVFIFLILFPALLQGLIISAVVQARGEKAENDRHAGRWGRKGETDV